MAFLAHHDGNAEKEHLWELGEVRLLSVVAGPSYSKVGRRLSYLSWIDLEAIEEYLTSLLTILGKPYLGWPHAVCTSSWRLNSTLPSSQNELHGIRHLLFPLL